jgi:hypothetical protein
VPVSGCIYIIFPKRLDPSDQLTACRRVLPCTLGARPLVW